jgi:hypothetical protein
MPRQHLNIVIMDTQSSICTVKLHVAVNSKRKMLGVAIRKAAITLALHCLWAAKYFIRLSTVQHKPTLGVHVNSSIYTSIYLIVNKFAFVH